MDVGRCKGRTDLQVNLRSSARNRTCEKKKICTCESWPSTLPCTFSWALSNLPWALSWESSWGPCGAFDTESLNLRRHFCRHLRVHSREHFLERIRGSSFAVHLLPKSSETAVRWFSWSMTKLKLVFLDRVCIFVSTFVREFVGQLSWLLCVFSDIMKQATVQQPTGSTWRKQGERMSKT